jgi:hypothetical protein
MTVFRYPLEQIEPIQRILDEHIDTANTFPPIGRLPFELGYLLELARASPVDFYYDSRFREVVHAIDVLIKRLPNQIAEAERLGKVEVAAGRATGLWQPDGSTSLVSLLRAIQAAVEPFRGIQPSKNPRGEWHEQAVRIHQVLLCYLLAPKLSFNKEDGGAGGRLISALLELADIKQSPETVANVILNRQREAQPQPTRPVRRKKR